MSDFGSQTPAGGAASPSAATPPERPALGGARLTSKTARHALSIGEIVVCNAAGEPIVRTRDETAAERFRAALHGRLCYPTGVAS